MKPLLTAALGMALILPARLVAADDAQARLTGRVEACISGHAAEVARAEPNLASAVDVLVNDMCGQEIEIEQRYSASAKLLGLLKSQQKTAVDKAAAAAVAAPVVHGPPAQAASGHPAQAAPPPLYIAPVAEMQARQRQAQESKLAELERARVNADTGEIEGLPGSQAGLISMVTMVFEQFQHNHSPARYRAEAARALLAARAGR